MSDVRGKRNAWLVFAIVAIGGLGQAASAQPTSGPAGDDAGATTRSDGPTTRPAGPLVARISSTDRGSATIDKGSAEGVKHQMRFGVERGGREIAELIVVVEHEHSAYCVADGVNEPLKPGDKAVAKARQTRPLPLITTQPDLLIGGRVRAAKFGRVELNVGSRAGVARGSKFVIYRKSKALARGVFEEKDADPDGRVYVCTVVIDQVHEDWSSGQAESEWEPAKPGHLAAGEKPAVAPPEPE